MSKRKDKLIRVTEATHLRLMNVKRRGESFDQVIERILEGSLKHHQIKQASLQAYDEVLETLKDCFGKIPAKSANTYGVQMAFREIENKVLQKKVEILSI